MMRKRNPLQNNDTINTKEAINQNAKVTVQYIQSQELFQKPYNNDNSMNQDDLEIENVEYLEENTNVEEYIEDPGDKDEFGDNFYPNAIHCLLDLYKIKYTSLSTEPDFKAEQLWREIAKDMQESFFDFSERQIQQKYASLRTQYIAVQSKEDIENFDYFEQLHDIYKDQCKENLYKGVNDTKHNSVYYKDEELLQAAVLEINEDHIHNLKNKEPGNKEHEFIDMVEKELQAMEEGAQLENNKEMGDEVYKTEGEQNNGSNAIDNVESASEKSPTRAKRPRVQSENCEEPQQRKSKLDDYFAYNEVMQDPCSPSIKTSNEFSLYHYNQEQEKRHREKIALLRQSLQIQERALKQQQKLLEELISRLPS